jgi:hypothetical protein
MDIRTNEMCAISKNALRKYVLSGPVKTKQEWQSVLRRILRYLRGGGGGEQLSAR